MLRILFILLSILIINTAQGQDKKLSFNFSSAIRSIDCQNERAVIGLDNGKIYLKNINDNDEAKLIGSHSERVNQVKWSKDGESIISCSNDGTVILWMINENKSRIMREHEGPVFAVAVDPNGKWIASGGIDGKVILWDYISNEIKYMKKHSSAVWSLDFNKNGTILASAGGEGDNSVILWKISKDLTISPIKHEKGINSVRFSENGTEIITVSNDKSSKIWKILNKKVEYQYGFENPVIHSQSFGEEDDILILKENSKAIFEKNKKLEKEQLFYEHQELISDFVYNKEKKLLLIGDTKGSLNILYEPFKKKALKTE